MSEISLPIVPVRPLEGLNLKPVLPDEGGHMARLEKQIDGSHLSLEKKEMLKGFGRSLMSLADDEKEQSQIVLALVHIMQIVETASEKAEGAEENAMEDAEGDAGKNVSAYF